MSQTRPRRRKWRLAVRVALLASFAIGVLCLTDRPAKGATNPWSIIQERYQKSEAKRDPIQISKKNVVSSAASQSDPWHRLQAVFLPFTEQEERTSETNRSAAKKITRYFHENLTPYQHFIEKASRIFKIPSEVIGAVIMVESGGNPRAKAKSCSASGLMQTIQATFQEARQGLREMGLLVANSPFDPEASIMAGSWYLNQMFEQAQADGKQSVVSRGEISSWHIPAQYYYAGPGNGRKEEEKVIIYSGGNRIVVDKPAYSQKVMRWAKIMRG